MFDATIELAITNTVRESMEIYAASTAFKDGTETKRTEWQDGWNAYDMELSKRQRIAEAWFKSLPDDKRPKISEMLTDGAAFLGFEEDQIKIYFLTSDLFAWGYADWEEITDELLEPLYRVFKTGGAEAMCAWWCKHENQKPQWPVEKSWRESGLWDADLESLPECAYDQSIGRWKDNPKPPWKPKPGATPNPE